MTPAPAMRPRLAILAITVLSLVASVFAPTPAHGLTIDHNGLVAIIVPVAPTPAPTATPAPPAKPAKPKPAPAPTAPPAPPEPPSAWNGGIVAEPWQKCQGWVGALIKQYFWDDLAWADKVADRESSCFPAAQNPSSTAAGVFQMLKMHAPKFAAVNQPDSPCSWSHRYEAHCNIRAARYLYNMSKRGPWSM